MKSKGWIAALFLLGIVMAGWAAETPPTVAVLDFSIPAAESNRWAWAEGGVSDLLQIELQQQGLLLLDRDGIHAVLAEQRLASNGRTAENCLTIAKLLNAQYLITGKVVPLAGDRFRVEAGAFSVEAVETELTATGEGDFPKELSRVAQEVAKQIAKKIPTRSHEFPDKTQPTTHAPKPESLIMFYRGLNACARGQPSWGAAYFMNAASLDSEFTVPLLWEIKAYEMAGLTQPAAIRREELAEVLKRLGVETAGRTNLPALSSKPVLAVLNPVVATGSGIEAASLDADLTHALLATDQVRVFAFQGIGSAIAEQDLRLSSFFNSQNAPRYDRWLASDGLVLGRVCPAKKNLVSLELSLVNPVNASVMACVQRTVATTTLSGQIPAIVGELLAAWTNRLVTANTSVETPEPSASPSDNGNTDLRPVYRDLVAAMAQVRCEPGKSDSHRALADAFAATGRTRLAAYEIEQCLKTLDIHAPHADTTYLGTHRWLFWEPSPASGAVGLVDPRAIDHLIEQLLTTYPQTLAAGCMRYNLAVSAWRTEKWADAITQAQQCRQVMQPIIALYDRNNTTVNGGECDYEIAAATYFLEGASLDKLGKPEAARAVSHRGLDFMQAFKVRNFCLPFGPFIGDFFGPQRVYGYGGDAPGIQTRLEEELAKLGEKISRPPPAESLPVAATKTPGADWIQKGQLEIQKGNYPPVLECYQKAMAAGASIKDCPGLGAALLEVALDGNSSHPREEMEKLRLKFGFPPVEASWVDWFAAGRKYQTSRQFDFQKAVACYRGTLDFLEHPEQMGVYHLEPQPNCDRIALRGGQGLSEMDILWSQNYNERWCNAAYYLAHCLVELNQKEEAAQWLRQIAIKEGGDTIFLLITGNWNGGSGQEVQLGVRAAELLKQLHQEPESPKFGETDGPYKRPAYGSKARSFSELPPPTTPNPDILQALTNLLATATYNPRDEKHPNPQLQAFVQQYGHAAVPALLSLLPRAGELWDEPTLGWLLGQTAAPAEAVYVVAACKQHWGLIAGAMKLDFEATAEAAAEEWRAQSESGFVHFLFIFAILDARLRPLYPLVMDHIAEKKANHHSVIFRMDEVVRKEKSDELETAFQEALSRCLKLKLQQNEYYELPRISQIALRHGVPEAIDGFMACEGSSPEKLRADLGSVLDLPAGDNEVIAFLRANASRWEWNPGQKKFTLKPSEKS